MKTTSRKGPIKSSAPLNEDLDRISASLQVLARSFNQARAHEHILREAGVRIDRAGAALLYKLDTHVDSSFRVSELAERLGIDAPAVTRKVQQLERLGFVARDADPEDKRATRIRLTSSGEETLQLVRQAHKKRLARLFDEWTAEDLRTFGVSMSRFAEALTKDMESYRD
ncbi:MAG TPA: MarR family transcriptional regulator [Acidimicrobiales bacterium]|nr:MarR family transcriptional regulator [Acidimicrobiales bacterium]